MNSNHPSCSNGRQFTACLLLLLVTGFLALPAAGEVSIPPPAPDEPLFLLRLLEQLPSFYDPPSDDPAVIQRSLAEWRHVLVRHSEDLRQRNMDPLVRELFAKQTTLVDELSNYYVQIGKIDQSVADRLQKDSFSAGYAGGSAGSGAAYLASQNGASDSNAALTGIAVGLMTYLWENHQKGQERDAARRAVVDAADQQLQRKVSEYRASCEAAVLRLTERYHWKSGEAGFDNTPQGDQQMLSLMQEGNVRGMVSVLNGLVVKRPRDPFLITSLVAASANTETDAQKLEALSDRCQTAQGLVPPSAIYDPYRLMTASVAADTMARSMGTIARARPLTGSDILRAKRGAVLWDKCISLSPGDVTGELRERKAWMLALEGKTEEAMQLAQSVESLRKDTLRYCYNMALLKTAIQDYELAFGWLKMATTRVGFDPRMVKGDRRFAPLNTADYPGRFDELLRVHWAWDVKFGLVNDDILLRNDSPYAISHVVFHPGIRAGGKMHSPELKADVILPGQVYKWTNAVSIPGSHIESTNASLNCDQSR